MHDRLELFKRLAGTAGISGCEKRTAELITSLAKSYVDDVYTDNTGNVICHKKGAGKKLLFAAHMDVVGFYVTGMDDKGNIFVDFSGGVNRSSIWNRSIRFEGGAHGVLRPAGVDFFAKKESDIKACDLFVETGAATYDEAKNLVFAGEGAVWEGDTVRCGDGVIMSPYIDDAAGMIVLLEMMEKLRANKNELYFVFTVCEEIGSFGARAASYGVPSDYAIAIDVAPATDALSGNDEHYRMSLGKGAALTLREKSFIANRSFRDMLVQTAEANGIAYQAKLSRGNTDARMFAYENGGMPSMSVGIPQRYIHTPCEMVCEKDMDSVRDLLCAFAAREL